MKSIFETGTRAEVIGRIRNLTTDNRPNWGKMNVEEMIKHCSLCEEYYLGQIKIKRSLMGRIFGKAAIKAILKNDESGLGKNAPTPKQFIAAETEYDLEKEKKNWISMIENYADYNCTEFTHWFFGKLTKDQLGCFIYKHTNHHLRQFGV